ncbi:MAG: pyridoxal-phosphate dependent enzyme [Anaerolineales bacterium]|nr:pyridoxal-phosphate dependent enzyme [Anaerolineales bacterium]
MFPLITFQNAHARIHPHINQTPLTVDPRTHLYLKWENHQPTHSFKVRGAINKILSMQTIPPALITGSAGNHGQAVARAAQIVRQITSSEGNSPEAWVFVPEHTPNVKVNRMLDLGAKVERVPGLFGDAEAKAIQTAREMGVPFISAYNDPEVIAGAGTIALEMFAELPLLERILVPAGGGGLISGVGLAAKAIKPAVEVIGVLAEASPYLYHQFYYGHTQDVVEYPTLTDGLAGAIEPGSITLDLITQACDAIIQVTEEEVAAAVAYLYRELGETVEGSGAVGLAAVLAGKIRTNDRVTGAVVSGGNIDPEKLAQVLARTENINS